MRILFFGSSEFAIPTFDSISSDGHEIVAAVTQPDRARGRGKHALPTPLRRRAEEAGIPVVAPEDVNAPDIASHLKSLRAELGYVAAFGQKIGPELLGAFPAGLINLHASLLPALRGAAPIQWAVINGDAETGVTIFRLVERMDAGPILVQRRTVIGLDETSDELHDRLARIGCDAARAAIEVLKAQPEMPGVEQDESRATRAPKLRKSDGRIRFDRPAAEVARRICGLWSWPGASCRFVSSDGTRDEVVILARAVPYEGSSGPASEDEAGAITEMMSVQCLDAEMTVLEIKPAGGKLMTWRDFVNGRHVRAGDRLVAADATGRTG